MEVPWQNCFSDLDMDEIDFFNQSHKTYSFDDDEEFLMEIFRQPSFSSESDSTHSSSIQNNPVTAASDPCGGVATAATATTPNVNSLSLDNNDSSGVGSQLKRNSSSSSSIASKLSNLSDKPVVVASSSSPSTYILSFDNSTVLPATSDVDGYRKHDESAMKSGNQEKLASSTRGGGGGGIRASQKRTLENHNSDHQPKANQGTKKTRSSSESLDHIMAERKRRQELTEKFIALSATIPGLKKIDKASILSEAIIHVKQLKERVRELEEQNKKMMTTNMEQSVSYMKKKKKKRSSLSPSLPRQDNIEDTTTTSCEIMSSDDYFKISESLPEVEARVLQRQVLIRIHCENEKGVIINLLAQLHGLHFSIISDSVLPFGNSTLDITIVAEVDEEHKIAVKELVKKLRMTLLKSAD